MNCCKALWTYFHLELITSSHDKWEYHLSKSQFHSHLLKEFSNSSKFKFLIMRQAYRTKLKYSSVASTLDLSEIKLCCWKVKATYLCLTMCCSLNLSTFQVFKHHVTSLANLWLKKAQQILKGNCPDFILGPSNYCLNDQVCWSHLDQCNEYLHEYCKDWIWM